MLELYSVPDVSGFEWPLLFLYMYPLKLPLSSCLTLIFEWPLVFFSPSLLSLDSYISNVLKCLASLTLLMKFEGIPQPKHALTN